MSLKLIQHNSNDTCIGESGMKENKLGRLYTIFRINNFLVIISLLPFRDTSHAFKNKGET